MSDRTRTYTGTYTSKDNKKHKVNVRVYKRLAAFGLSIVLVKGAYSFTVNNIIGSNTDTNDIAYSEEALSESKALIESIIKEDPNILKDVELSDYVIKAGDSISSIAEKCGNTVARICSLNNLKKNQTIYAGDEIRVETIVKKEGNDKEIAALESYIYQYVMNSAPATLAKDDEAAKEAGAAMYYRSIIYGNPKSNTDTDPDSIIGRFMSAYLSYHEREGEITDEVKTQYVSKLKSIADDAYQKLSLSGMSDDIVPYDTYEIYLENGTTKYDEIQDTYHSIYS